MRVTLPSAKYLLAAAFLVASFLTTTSTASACAYADAYCWKPSTQTWEKSVVQPLAVSGVTVYFYAWEYGFPPDPVREWNYGDGTGWHTGGQSGSCNYTEPGQKNVIYRVNGQTSATSTCTVLVVQVDLDIAEVPEANEENPGGFLQVNHDDDNGNAVEDGDDTSAVGGENELLQVTLDVLPSSLPRTDVVTLTWTDAKIDVFEGNDRSNPISSGKQYQLSQLPLSLWVEGDVVSDSLRDVEMKLEYVKDSITYEDKVNLTVARVQLTHLKFDYSSGTSTGLTSTTLTDSHANWATNEFAGCTLYPDIDKSDAFTVQSNTAATITVTSGDMTAHAASGAKYSAHYDNDALRIRQNYDTDVNLPEWVTESPSTKSPAAYIKGKSVKILARFAVTPTSITQAKINALTVDILDDLDEVTVNFDQGVSSPEYIRFPAQASTPNYVTNDSLTWEWRLRDLNGVATPSYHVAVCPVTADNDGHSSGPHTIYVLLASPYSDPSEYPPWDKYEKQLPWTDAMDYTCTWAGELSQADAGSAAKVASKVTEKIYGAKLKYDNVYGEPHYLYGGALELGKFIDEALKGATENASNCVDCATAVTTFANVVGCGMKPYMSSESPWDYFGYINAVDPIGNADDYTNNPFHGDAANVRDDLIAYQDGTVGSCGRSGFGMHAFAGLGAGPTIFDATMKGNAKSNKDTTIKYPAPNGTAYSTGLSATVLTDANANWTADQWIGCKLNPNANTTTPDPYKTYTIVDNDATTITVSAGSNMVSDASSWDYYEIFDPADPEFEAEWLRELSWDDYKPEAVDTGGAPDPTAFSFDVINHRP